MTLEEVEEQVRIALERLRHPCPDFAFDGAEPADLDGEELLFATLERLTLHMVQHLEEETRPASQVAKIKRVFGARGPDRYSRQTWMTAHEKVMGSLRADWGDRVRVAHEATLRRYPLTPIERGAFRDLDLARFGLRDD